MANYGTHHLFFTKILYQNDSEWPEMETFDSVVNFFTFFEGFPNTAQFICQDTAGQHQLQ